MGALSFPTSAPNLIHHTSALCLPPDQFSLTCFCRRKPKTISRSYTDVTKEETEPLTTKTSGKLIEAEATESGNVRFGNKINCNCIFHVQILQILKSTVVQ